MQQEIEEYHCLVDMSVEQISELNVAELIILKSQNWQLENHGQFSSKEKEWHDINKAQYQALPAHLLGSSGVKTEGVYRTCELVRISSALSI